MSNVLNIGDLLKVSDKLSRVTSADVENCSDPEHIRQRLSRIDFVLTEVEGEGHLHEHEDGTTSDLLEELTRFDRIQLPFEVPGTEATFLNIGVAWLQFLKNVGVVHHYQREHHLVAA